MRKLILYIACSADGYIARKNGLVDWLPAPNPNGPDYGYATLLKSIDTILWGRKTYEQALAFGPFPEPRHAGKKHFVFSKKKMEKTPSIQWVSSNPVGFARRLKFKKGKSIWLMGGAHLIAPLHQAGLIDQYIVTVCPVFLGNGIPLFLPAKVEQKLQLIKSKSYPDGLVQLTYEKAKKKK